MSGIERAPLASLNAKRLSPRQSDSLAVFNLIGEHLDLTEDYLGIGTEKPFLVDAASLKARQDQLAWSRSESHHVSRGVQEIAVQLGATVERMEKEMEKTDVLDIGCGDGTFGDRMGRAANARVTFLELDPTVMPPRSRYTNRQVLASGESLPFPDESFDKTLSAFSTLTWANSPLSALRCLSEAIRVTRVGGTYFAVPIMSQVMARHNVMRYHMQQAAKGVELKDGNDLGAMKVWALQDYLLLTCMLELEAEGMCSVSLASFIGQGGKTGNKIESYSAIIDKKSPITQEFFDGYNEYAKSFYVEELASNL